MTTNGQPVNVICNDTLLRQKHVLEANWQMIIFQAKASQRFVVLYVSGTFSEGETARRGLLPVCSGRPLCRQGCQ